MIRIPLLRDNHNHLFTYSSLNDAASLFDVHDKKTALKLLSKGISNKISVATGWFDSYYNFSESELNDLPATIICNNSLHSYLFNKKAADIIVQTWPEWVENNNNSVWVESNIMNILAFISGLFGFDEENLKLTLEKNLNAGVAFASDMFVKSPEIFEYLSKNKNQNFTEIWTDPDLYPLLDQNHKDICKGVKLFTDGAIGASTAAISGYRKSGNAFLTYTDTSLSDKLEFALDLKTEIAIHAIGDIAIEQVLKTIEKYKTKAASCKIRLEHVQFINKNQAFRARDLNLNLSMQPNFNMDSLVYDDRLTTEYCVANNPFRMLIDDAGFIPGKNLIFGSDGMPTGIEGTLQQSLFPPTPGQKLSLDEFVAAYCCESMDKDYISVEIDQLKKKVVTEVITG
jgi:predicted amidohydrolase YtcJ